MELLAFQVFFVVAETGANKFELIAKNCFPGCLNWAETVDPTRLPQAGMTGPVFDHFSVCTGPWQRQDWTAWSTERTQDGEAASGLDSSHNSGENTGEG